MNIFDLQGKLKIEGIEKGKKQVGGLQTKVKSMAKGLRVAGAAMTALGGIIVAVAAKAVKDFARMGDEVHKMSLRTGVATEALSKFKYAAELGGASLGDVEKAIKRMAATIYDAEEGLSTSVDAMNNLGVSIKDLQGLSPEDQFMKLAGALAAIEDSSVRAALAQRIFGRAGTTLLPMLEDGTEGLREMMAEAEKFAPIFGKDAAEAAAKLTDTLTQLKGTLDKIKMSLAAKLVPVLTSFLEKLRDTIGKVGDWTEKNPELTKTIALMAVALGGILLVLGPLLIALPTLIKLISVLGIVIHLAMGPIGWIILGIIALIAAGIALWRNWDKVVSFFTGGTVEMARAIDVLVDKVRGASEDMIADSERATEAAISNAEQVANAERRRLDERAGFYRDFQYERMRLLDEQMIAEIRAVDPVLAAELEASNKELAAIDERVEARKEADEDDRRAALEKALRSDDLTRSEKRRIKRELEAIEDARLEEQTLEERNRKISELNMAGHLEKQKTVITTQLEAQIKMYKDDEAALKLSLENKEKITAEHVKKILALYGKIAARGGIEPSFAAPETGPPAGYASWKAYEETKGAWKASGKSW